MIKVRIFSEFTAEANGNNYIDIYHLEGDPDYAKKFIFTNGDDYTHAIIFNRAMPNLSISKENVIGVAQEPNPFLSLHANFINYAKRHISKYFIGDTSGLPDPFVEYYGYMVHMPFLQHIPIKNKIMSIMVSASMSVDGHKYRHLLVKNILKTQLPIDIWGGGCKFYNVNDDRIRGPFDINSTKPYESYLYHVSIENFRLPHYFSEKIINPLIYGTIPIYYGCYNISKYFPNQIIDLSGNIDNDMQLLENICSNPDKYKLDINVDKVKDFVSIKRIILENFT
jgi:hypothetical protein